jgi:hypothetical protein
VEYDHWFDWLSGPEPFVCCVWCMCGCVLCASMCACVCGVFFY